MGYEIIDVDGVRNHLAMAWHIRSRPKTYEASRHLSLGNLKGKDLAQVSGATKFRQHSIIEPRLNPSEHSLNQVYLNEKHYIASRLSLSHSFSARIHLFIFASTMQSYLQGVSQDAHYR